jgi:hypothetical protein
VHVHPLSKKTTKKNKQTLRILDFNVNITILLSLCSSDGYHFTIDKTVNVMLIDKNSDIQ